jgi:S-DNA-T family DNA segregation ATPase FtsK/SpoIIIE
VATTNKKQRRPRSSTTRSGGTARRPRKRRSAAQATSDREVQGLLLIAAGVLLALALYTGTTGLVGDLLADVTGWLVGLARYLSPLAFLWLGWHRLRTAPMPRTRSRRKRARRLEPAQGAAWALLFVAAFSILDLIGGRPWNGSTVAELSRAGGQVGVRIGGTLESLLGHWGHILITVTMVLVAATILTSISAGWVLDAIVAWVRTSASHVSGAVSNLDIDLSRLGWSRTRGASSPVQDPNDPLFDIEITGPEATGEATGAPAERYIDLRQQTGEFDDLPPGPPDPLADLPDESPPVEGSFEDEPPVRVSRFDPAPVAPEPVAISTPQPEGGEWRLPSLSLLLRSESQDVDEIEVRERGKRLERALREHSVETRLIGVRVGPTISMFEYELAPRVKVSRVTSLKQDIAYAMATPDVRILAPIPGKQAIGVEVPNVNRSLVTVGDLLVSKEAAASTHPLEVGLGRDITGRTIMINLADMPHLLVAGQTGSGKSSCINTMLTSILMRSTPEQVRMILVDPKRVELTQYDGLPHLLSEVVTDPKKAANALNWAVREMERRYDLLQEVGVRDITGYNLAVDQKRLAPRVMPDGSLGDYERLSFLLIVLDELSDLMMVAGKDVEESIVRIAQKARAVGIHLVIATQRPSTNVITGLIKANVPARLAFSVSSLTDSRVILDAGGAENLVGRGDGLINDGTTSELTRFQGAWVTEHEVAEVVDFWRHQAPDVEFDPRVQGEETGSAGSGLPGGSTGDAEDDELLLAAMEIVVSSQRASVSDFQRKLRVGFARAGRLMDELEERGIVGPNVGSKVRDVLVTPGDLDQLRAAQAPPSPAPRQQRLLQPPVASPAAQKEPRPTLPSVPNPSSEPLGDATDAHGRPKALPRPLTEAEKAREAAASPPARADEAAAADDGDRDIVDHAGELIINSQLGSVPMLQRKLRVDLAEAERVMNKLEERGIVGPAQGVRAREVLVKPDDPSEATRDEDTASVVPEAPALSAEVDLADSPTTDDRIPDDEITAGSDGESESFEIDADPDLDGDFDPALAPPPGYPNARQ